MRPMKWSRQALRSVSVCELKGVSKWRCSQQKTQRCHRNSCLSKRKPDLTGYICGHNRGRTTRLVSFVVFPDFNCGFEFLPRAPWVGGFSSSSDSLEANPRRSNSSSTRADRAGFDRRALVFSWDCGWVDCGWAGLYVVCLAYATGHFDAGGRVARPVVVSLLFLSLTHRFRPSHLQWPRWGQRYRLAVDLKRSVVPRMGYSRSAVD